MRQRRFPPHKDTNSIVLAWNRNIFTGHMDPTTGGVMATKGWFDFLPALKPLFELVREQYNYSDPRLWKAMLARLPAGKSITTHSDMAPVLFFPHRVHWVLRTNPKVKTLVEGERIKP